MSEATPTAVAEASVKSAEAPKLTGAELKRQKQAEKAARRAQAKPESQGGSAAVTVIIPRSLWRRI
jgi:hypothetical protein